MSLSPGRENRVWGLGVRGRGILSQQPGRDVLLFFFFEFRGMKPDTTQPRLLARSTY